jgi:hypothetical protein
MPSTPDQLIADARAAAFTDEHPQHAFDHFRPLTDKVPQADLPVFTGQALVMRANVRHALQAIEPYLVTAVARLSDPRLQDIFELPALTTALDFAAARVPLAKLSAGEIQAKLDEGAPWRELMLSYLEVASHPLVGLLPAERVRAVRAGKGKLDMARDFVSVVGLFSEFSTALAGKHPFPPEKLDLLSTLGGQLVGQLKPGQAVGDPAQRTPESVLRDRFAWLVADRYDALQALAAVAVGYRKVEELLPALRTAVMPPAAPAPAAPAAAPATPAANPTAKTDPAKPGGG